MKVLDPNQPRFPDNFLKKPAQYMKKETWVWPISGKTKISVIGGEGCYGDGINTFEIWDFREPEPEGYKTKDEINNYLRAHPF